MEVVQITAPRYLNDVFDVDCFLIDGAVEDSLVVDLGRVKFFRPVAITSFLASLARFERSDDKDAQDKNILLTLPENPLARRYLLQAGVFDVMREFAEFEGTQPEDVIPNVPPIRPMVSCTHFRTDEEIEYLAEQMEESFHTELIGYASLLQPCEEVFAELATNVVYHAESDGGFVLAQQYKRAKGTVVEIAVADSGIGVKESLSKNEALIANIQSDCEAITLSLEEGISSLRDSHRGYGLSHVTYNVHRVINRKMTIRSGNGIIEVHGDGSVQEWEHDIYYPGTIVNVTIPCYG